MSLEITLTVTGYNKETNTCKAEDSFGRTFDFDPFVGGGIPMTEEQYENDFGFSIVGNKYCVYSYSFSNSQLVPHQEGIVKIGRVTWNK